MLEWCRHTRSGLLPVPGAHLSATEQWVHNTLRMRTLHSLQISFLHVPAGATGLIDTSGNTLERWVSGRIKYRSNNHKPPLLSLTADAGTAGQRRASQLASSPTASASASSAPSVDDTNTLKADVMRQTAEWACWACSSLSPAKSRAICPWFCEREKSASGEV